MAYIILMDASSNNYLDTLKKMYDLINDATTKCLLVGGGNFFFLFFLFRTLVYGLSCSYGSFGEEIQL